LAVRIASDKCDWRIAAAKHLSPQRVLRPVADKCDGAALQMRPGIMEFSGANRRFGGVVASDKCDWRVRAVDDVYTANMQALGRKLQVDIGLKKGQRIRFTGASSDKCDFRLQDVEIFEHGNWRPLSEGTIGQIAGPRAAKPAKKRGKKK
jgi:hypothetical protein